MTIPDEQAVEAAAKALVPFSYGAFERQVDERGYRVQPPFQPNDHARRAAAAALEAAQPLMGVQRPDRENVVRVIKSNVYAHPDPADKALAFVDDESIGEAADAVLALPHTGQPQEGRCEICDWPLAKSAAEGCAPGNCSYRPSEGSPEWHRIRARRDALSATAPQAGCAKEGERGDRIDLITKVIDGCAVTQAERDIIVAALRERAARRAGPTAERAPPPPVAESGWQEIETAPKDGKDVLLHWPLPGLSDNFDRTIIGYWSDSQQSWIFQGRAARSYSRQYQPTHWRPLPVPPAIVAEKQTEEQS